MTKPEHLAEAPSLLADALGRPAFPWQNALLEAFTGGQIPPALDLPTGLGKTSVMAIWLVARMLAANVPRRLVYVVDRRAVVDQATTEALRLRKWVQKNPPHAHALGLENNPLPISTLRGQFVDNREWLEDPAKPAIIVGTVDMIGSRLLFEGYGSSRKIRPYQAALLACDSLFVIDEAHLIPPFEALLTSISQNATLHASTPSILADRPPPARVLSLSATQRKQLENPFSLTDLDLTHPIVKQRLEAEKRLRILPAVDGGKLADELISAAWNIYKEKNAPVSCLVFCDSRDDATKVAKGLLERAKKEKIDAAVELFVGGRRIREREKAAKDLEHWGLLPTITKMDQTEANLPRFVVATSAAEVGVDLDANHLVCDVVPWERMVQRLGRVNRRGQGSALVRVVATPQEYLKKQIEKKTKDKNEGAEDDDSGRARRYHATLTLLQKLPKNSNDEFEASPLALRCLARNEELKNEIEAASTPAPLHPALDRATLDAWAMTSLPEHPGRPFVAPWLRGWVDDEPQVTLVWRRYLAPKNHEVWSKEQWASFVEAVPVHTSEGVEVEVARAKGWLKERVKTIVGRWKKASDDNKLAPEDLSLDSVVALVVDGAGEFVKMLKLRDLVIDEKTAELVEVDRKTWRRNEIDLERDYLLQGTLILDRRLGGLDEHGLLDDGIETAPVTADGESGWLEGEEPEAPVIRFEISVVAADEEEKIAPKWQKRLRLPWEMSADGEASQWLMITKWRHDAATEEDRSAGNPQLLSDHQAWTEERAALLGKRLQLSDRGIKLLKVAARLHDEGKRAKIWQRAMKAPTEPKGAIWAKTKGPVAPKLLNGYRHEFGSLEYVARDAEFLELSSEERDLVLHMVAAHHGNARPLIGTNGVENLPPSVLKTRAQEVALRYFRLSEQWGPWGLAYWESLLRAADQQASRDNDLPKKEEGL